ncbi:MAG: phosphoribosylamine--glycine ligase, partial [Acidimicrobiia bacterium]|nr:phosphoribosylamine--glycine ligase [Acidimicrobiia bacterium]
MPHGGRHGGQAGVDRIRAVDSRDPRSHRRRLAGVPVARRHDAGAGSRRRLLQRLLHGRLPVRARDVRAVGAGFQGPVRLGLGRLTCRRRCPRHHDEPGPFEGGLLHGGRTAVSCVLVVGGGGREHALAWALSRSPHVGRLLVAPGNPGTAALDRTENVATSTGDVAGRVGRCRRGSGGLAVIGPEDPLAAGIVDALASAGVAAFGPSATCARLEASKAYCKRFLIDNGIPTAAAEVFGDPGAALAHLASRPDVPVVKASGLAAGKGVIVPETEAEAAGAVKAMLTERRFGSAGEQILLEERLWGREVSVLAFCDGERFAALPPAQDHKRLRAGDEGPNTGGMGAFTPSPATDDRLIDQIGRQVIAPTLAALGRAGTPYRG